jgi:hypothetical protein
MFIILAWLGGIRWVRGQVINSSNSSIPTIYGKLGFSKEKISYLRTFNPTIYYSMTRVEPATT